MLNEKSELVLRDYLSQHPELKVVSSDSVIGFISGLLACSEFYGESEIANYIADKNDPIYTQLMTSSAEHDAMITLLDNVTEAQVAQQHILASIYPHGKDAKAPSEQLQQWCVGYLAAYMVNQEVWQHDFNFLLSADKQVVENQADGQLFIDNFEATLNLLATFAMWPDSLKEHPEPAVLSEGFALLYTGLDESLTGIASMALMLEDEKLALWEEEG
ncbi:hypothetical protein H5154_10470 [Pseudoalteromonas sp. SR44-5]|uniref:YecA family protein n=1 Tax=Pseudoalteromonas rhizosphaerae TaxID=2518973 RepID=A0ABW8L3M2_9GAMM|nr:MULTISPECIES: hypothetical protein [unclassified Pseudoalteromonas]MBB1334297.1 hypothetical protein [Pseudoalteromonas sp. SR41-6]MBB1342095.1 hypothetical protein [Pseudoalteromonas sp. SR45-6]MBB1366801.1 hypothetical protein [Pseudoalteromonas sp. SR44-5]MBB1417602.1 hypothetical protein [Pseudoalteromonas sp. SG44-1]MBB1423171.1 hypothetical protein [Pseudoalteromonas sp. SG43-7]